MLTVLIISTAWLLGPSPRPNQPLTGIPAKMTADTDEFGNVDGRGSITDKAAQLGLSAADVSQIRASVGYVVCPGSEGGNPVVNSATVIGTNMQIAAASHAFIDFSSNIRAPLSECYFRNQEEPHVQVMLDFETGYFNGAPVGAVRKASFDDEWAVVALKAPVPNARPFPLGVVVADGTRIIAVAAHQKTPPNLDPSQPVVQSCHKRDQAAGATAGLNVYVDCDIGLLASGGPILSRSVGGELVFQGIMVASGNEHLDGEPYNLSTSSYTRVVPPLGSFKDAIRAVAKSVWLTKGDKLRVSPH